MSERFLRAAREQLAPDVGALLAHLHAFTQQRFEAARQAEARILVLCGSGGCAAPALHAFLREAWETLDGLAREVNAVMDHLHPHAGLYPPLRMSRQCTFYMVRKLLHESPKTAGHSVSRLLWATRQSPDPAYKRLSFLYNVALFFPVTTRDGRLPGSSDLPEPARKAIRPQPAQGCGLEDGMREITQWLAGLRAECYRRLLRALRPATR